jgi:hypothetical protein
MVKQKKPFSPLDAHSLGFPLLHQISFLITIKIIGYIAVFTTKMVVFVLTDLGTFSILLNMKNGLFSPKSP